MPIGEHQQSFRAVCLSTVSPPFNPIVAGFQSGQNLGQTLALWASLEGAGRSMYGKFAPSSMCRQRSWSRDRADATRSGGGIVALSHRVEVWSRTRAGGSRRTVNISLPATTGFQGGETVDKQIALVRARVVGGDDENPQNTLAGKSRGIYRSRDRVA